MLSALLDLSNLPNSALQDLIGDARPSQSTKPRLVDLAPAIFMPGYHSAVHSRNIFSPRIVQALSSISRRSRSSSLMESIHSLQNFSPDGMGTSDGMTTLEQAIRVRLWYLIQRKTTAAKTKSSSKLRKTGLDESGSDQSAAQDVTKPTFSHHERSNGFEDFIGCLREESEGEEGVLEESLQDEDYDELLSNGSIPVPDSELLAESSWTKEALESCYPPKDTIQGSDYEVLDGLSWNQEADDWSCCSEDDHLGACQATRKLHTSAPDLCNGQFFEEFDVDAFESLEETSLRPVPPLQRDYERSFDSKQDPDDCDGLNDFFDMLFENGQEDFPNSQMLVDQGF